MNNFREEIENGLYADDVGKFVEENDMFCKFQNVYYVYCPLCKEHFVGSEYLQTVFTDERTLWLANMVMHYRHYHISSWNKMWGYHGYYYQRAAHFGDYDEEKKKVNERAKRQIARKCADYLIKHNVTVDIFKELQNTEEKTIEVVEKIWKKHGSKR